MKLRPAPSWQAHQEAQQQSKQTCEVTTCGLLAGATSTSGTKSSHLGMEHPRAAGSGEVKTWRGGAVVEAAAEVMLNDMAQISLLIYPRELEELHSSQLLAL